MRVLIAGAGPTGLTAAVELARRGITPDVIDFLASWRRGRLIAASDISEARWVNLDAIDTLPLTEGLAAVVEKALRLKRRTRRPRGN